MGLLLFTAVAAILILAFILNKTCHPMLIRPNWSPLAAFCVYSIPAIFFLLWVLTAPDEASRFRLALRGLGFNADSDTTQFTIGGDPKVNDVWIPQLPKTNRQNQIFAKKSDKKSSEDKSATVGTLELTTSSDKSLAKITLIHPQIGGQSWPPPALLLTKTSHGYDSPFFTTLQDGDELDYDGNSWRVNVQQQIFGLCPPAGSIKNKITLADPVILSLRSSCGTYSFTEQTHPLNYIFDTARSSPLLGLIYRNGTSIGLIILSRDIELWRNNKRVSVAATNIVPVANGSGIHIFRLPKNRDDPLDWSGLRDTRSFKVYAGGKHLLLEYDTPTITSLAWKDLKQLALVPDKIKPNLIIDDGNQKVKEINKLRIGLAMGDWHITDQSLQFTNVSHTVGSESFAMLEFPDEWSFKDKKIGTWQKNQLLTVASPGGRSRVEPSTPFWIGEHHLAAFQFDLLTPPLELALLALVLGLIKAMAANTLRLSAIHLIVAAMLELFIAFRVILAYRVWIMPPSSEEAMRWSLIAWSLLPWAFLLACIPAKQYKNQTIYEHLLSTGFLTISGVIFSAVWCWQISGGGITGALWILFHLLLMTIFLTPWATVWDLLYKKWMRFYTWIRTKKISKDLSRIFTRVKLGWIWLIEKIAHYWANLVHVIDGIIFQTLLVINQQIYQYFLGTPEKQDSARWFRYWLFLSMLFPLLRGVLALLGMREAIHLGGNRFAISAIHIPLALALEARYLVWLWQRFNIKGSLQIWDIVSLPMLICTIWLLPSKQVSDFGLMLQVVILLAAWLWLMLTAWFTIPKRQRYAEVYLGFSMRGYTIILIMIVLSCGVFWAEMQLHFLYNDWQYDKNYLRIMNAFAPEQVRNIGDKDSEELTVMSDVLSAYTSNNFWGRGYAASELSNQIKATSLSDHVTAVFIAAEWGRIGVIGLGLLYIMSIYIGSLLMPWSRSYLNIFGKRRNSYLDNWSAVAGLAIATIGFSSLYMLIANHDFLIFTGKNIYLLGLASGSDVLESLILILIFASGATVVSNAIVKRG